MAITAAIRELLPIGDSPMAVKMNSVRSDSIGPHSNQYFLEPNAPAFTTRREIPTIFNRAPTGVGKPPRKMTTVANIRRGTAEATKQTRRALCCPDCNADQLDSDVIRSSSCEMVIGKYWIWYLG